MRSKIKLAVMVFFISLAITQFFTKDIVLCRSTSGERPSEPRLVYPTSEEVTITGDFLEFKWWHAAIGIDRYEFNLYKGGGPSGDAILEKTLPFNVSLIQVKTNLFEDNQVYTWTLRQVADNGLKSDESFVTFRAIKK